MGLKDNYTSVGGNYYEHMVTLMGMPEEIRLAVPYHNA